LLQVPFNWKSQWRLPLPYLHALCALCALWFTSPGTARAQQADSTRTGIAPPITPRRAFFYSLAIPGLGQARLDRPLVGAGFFLVEAFAIGVLHRSVDDLRLARAYQRDSIPLRYAVNPETGTAQLDSRGNPVVAAWEPAYYSPALTRARRLQVEDWSAVLVFNHLIAGAEAFVAAQLWDLPQHVKLRALPTRMGAGIGATVSIR
jgi:hypothetical protein